ncbi:MAG: hypothetical protein Q9162_002379, partial [Coniocarpon cinnabarinum]
MIGNRRGATSPHTSVEETSVLATFMKDVFEENASLKLERTELKDMLLRSQSEQEELRSQLTYTSPYLSANTGITPHLLPPGADLSSELESCLTHPQISRTQTPQPSPLSREIHIHHHTHFPPTAPATSQFSSSVPTIHRRIQGTAQHSRQNNSKSSLCTVHSRGESNASSIPSTVFESSSDAGYETDITSPSRPSRPTSPESATILGNPQFAPLDSVLESAKRPPLRRKGSGDSVLSVSGMDIHRSFQPVETGGGRPELDRSFASRASVK